LARLRVGAGKGVGGSGIRQQADGEHADGRVPFGADDNRAWSRYRYQSTAIGL
jgi:hypothetical protein